ncbi:hypothetical protein Tco_0090953 [Tanacetum coccineum]
MERAATTASSLEAERDSGSGPRCQDTILGGANAQTRFETASKKSNDPPLLGVNTLGSGEDSMKLKELMEFFNAGVSKLMLLSLNLLLPVLVYAARHILTAVRHKLMLPDITYYCGAKTVNGERQIQALFDKKKVIISETSIRRDLMLEDAEVLRQLLGTNLVALWHLLSSVLPQTRNLTFPMFLDKQVDGMSKHKEIYVTPSHTKKIFANIKRERKGFSGHVTPLFATMIVQAYMGKDSDAPTDSHPTPVITQPSSSQP